MMKKLIITLIGITVLKGISQAQEKIPSFVKDSLTQYIDRGLSRWKIPGVAVCIVKDGKLVLAKGYGVKEVGKSEKVDENTLFMIGSNTKAFTATALAMLASEKVLSLDDKVQKWLPSFKLHDPWVAKETNLRDLLSHRMGFETFQGDFMYFDSDLSKEQVLEKFALVEPYYSFRSRWGYTNAAFAVAGEVIHQASGKTWSEFMKDRIFIPLGMNQSKATSNEIHLATNKASAHTVANGSLKKIAYGKIDNMMPAGSISSSALDLSKWMLMLLNKGEFDNTRVVGAGAIEETWSPHSIMGNGGPIFNSGHFALYGLGWLLEEYNGKKIVSHTGGVNGFVTSLTLLPEENLGIVVLTNTDANGFFEALKLEIMDVYLGLPYRDYSSKFLERHEASELNTEKQLRAKRDTINMRIPPALSLVEYTGAYRHPVYGHMNIKMENKELVMTFEHHKGRQSKLEPLGGNRFLSTWSDPLFGVKVLPFKVENGKVKSVTVRVGDFVEFTPYEFTKEQ